MSKDGKSEIDYEKTLREYYADTKLWMLDDRRPNKGFPHPVEKTCESCPWATKDSICSIAAIPISQVEGCPRPNFEDDLELVKRTLNRRDYSPLAISNGRLKNKIIGAEIFFNTELNGVPVQGFIDLVIEVDQNTIEIIDYKTGNNTLNYDNAFKDPQVRIYGAVARTMFPQYKYVMVTLHYLRKNPVTVGLSERDDERTLESLKANYDKIRNNKNPKRYKNWLCNWCIGWENCSEVHENFKVDGKFRLPVINCNHSAIATEDEPCWGSLDVDSRDTSLDNIHLATYSCRGHKNIAEGGVYVSKASSNH